MTPNGIRLLIFGVICVVAVYIFSCLYYRRLQKIDLSIALLYITSVAMIGVLGEIFVDTIYTRIFGTQLWRYNFLPIHNGYTSQFSPILWGCFGFYLYLMHHDYKKWTPASTYQVISYIRFVGTRYRSSCRFGILGSTRWFDLLLLPGPLLAHNSYPEHPILLLNWRTHCWNYPLV